VSSSHFRAPCSYAGFSLLEVLVAGAVFSFGLAGLSALLLVSIIASDEARNEGIAAVAAANLAEQILLNPAALERYLNPAESISRICLGGDQCTAEQQADYDFGLWRIELADRIRNARGTVCHDSTPEDGVEGSSRCDGAGPLVIKIFWNGPEEADSQSSNQRRFTLAVG
jgi:type IV pilus modification protein PilV